MSSSMRWPSARSSSHSRALPGSSVSSGSEALEVGDRAFIADVSRVESGLGFEQQHVCFFVGDGQVLDAARNDGELPRAHHEVAVAQLQDEASCHDQEKLILA